MPLNGTDAVSLFSSFLCCVHGVEADSFREGGGALCVRVCVCVVCVGWRFR